MLDEKIKERLTNDPGNYAYLSGYLLAVIRSIEIELDVAAHMRKSPSVKRIRAYIARVKDIDALQTRLLAERRERDYSDVQNPDL